MDSLFYIGLIFVLGAIAEWVSSKLALPKVVLYLVLGLLIGPELLGIIPSSFVSDSHIIIELSLSIIALLVGSTIKFEELKKHAKGVFYITLFQSFGTFIIVSIGIVLVALTMNLELYHSIFIALLLGAIATATDTATPLAIVKEYKAKGEFTSTFLSVVAFDDAVALVIFTLTLTFSSALLSGNGIGLFELFGPFLTIILTVVLGFTAGLISIGFEKLFSHHKGMETISTLGMIFIVYSLSEYWALEPLLSAMVMGVVMVNLSQDFDLVQEEIDNHLVEIIFMLFFIISAMHLQLSALYSLPAFIVAYIVLRAFGKIVGSYYGAKISKSSKSTQKYMGLALLPQAGVAIGLSLSIQQSDILVQIAPIILNIVIATTFVHELIGPLLTKYALVQTKEVK